MAENSKTPAVSETAADIAQTPTVPGKKGRATPSRKQAEAKNIRPLVGGTNSKDPEARKAAKAALAAERARSREGMLAGEEKYLGIRDRGPQKKLARDVVDAERFTVGELLVPTMVLVLAVSWIQVTLVQVILIFGMWGLMGGIIFDGLRLGRKVNKAVAAKFGANRVEKGLTWYAAVRASQMRVMRLPKPQVARGVKL